MVWARGPPGINLKVSKINRNRLNSSTIDQGRAWILSSFFFTFFHKKARHLSTSLCATCAYLTSLVVTHTALTISTVIGTKLRAI